MENAQDDATLQMKTLSECLNQAVKDGYKEDFKMKGNGLVTEKEETVYHPENIAISNFFRFEGYSDPQDSAILYLIHTEDGKKGTLIDAYGAYADAKLSNFIRQVEDIQKKPENKNAWFSFLNAFKK